MTAPTLFRVLACTALLSAPLHAQLYTLHGDCLLYTSDAADD